MFTVEQIEKAHSNVKSGADFPAYIREIKALGVISFVTWVKDSHTEYYGVSNFMTFSLPKYSEMVINTTVNKDKFIQQLKNHQKGETDYIRFCEDCASTGIEKWIADLDAFTCIYYDQSGNTILSENIPH